MDRKPGHLTKKIDDIASSLVWVKVVGIGNSGVGKTCLIKHFCESKFTTGYQPTVGVDYGFKIQNIQNIDLRVHLWDLSGSTEYLDVRNELYGNTDAVFLVYDITNQATFDSLDTWMRELSRFSSNNVNICLVANKDGDFIIREGKKVKEIAHSGTHHLLQSDFKVKRAISVNDGKKWATAHKIQYFETSCQNGENVEKMFSELLNEVVTRKKAEQKL